MARNHGKADKSYQLTWRRFQKFITEARAAGRENIDYNTDSEKWITRKNIDAFFQEVVAEADVQPQTASRYASALQWYADRVEHTKTNERFLIREGFNCEVDKALDKQAHKFAREYILKTHDAHDNVPTDVLSLSDHLKVIDYVLSNSLLCYKNFGMSWTCCNSTFLRLDSLCAMRLCDLRADHAHGPVTEGPNSTILSMILQPYQHKDQSINGNGTRASSVGDGDGGASNQSARRARKHYKKRVVGMFRHHNFQQCGTSHIAMNLFMRLYRDHSFSFIWPANGKEQPPWQKVKLIHGWSESPQKTYARILNEVGVSWKKVTHLRSSGIEQASGAGGLSSDAVSTMSKHNQDRLFQCYMTELYEPVMRVMAGFRQSDPYFVARTEIPLPYSQDDFEYVKHVFPLYEVWLNQYNSPQGDKHKSAKNFLYQTIPFLARVVLQDGPYWIKHYPNHPYTSTLLSRMQPHYINWSRRAIQEAQELQDRRDIDNIQNLNAGARHAFEVQARSVDRLSNVIQEEVREENRQLHAELQRTVQSLAETTQLYQQQTQQLAQQHLALLELLQQQPSQPNQPNTHGGVPLMRLPQLQQEAERAQEEVRRQRLRQERRAMNLQRPQIHEALRAIPRQQELPRSLPELMGELVRVWKELGMSSYRPSSARRHWPQSKKVAFSKWNYLMKKIESRAAHGPFAPHVIGTEERLVHAASTYDDERKIMQNGSEYVMSTTQLMAKLKRQHGDTINRRPRQRRRTTTVEERDPGQEFQLPENRDGQVWV